MDSPFDPSGKVMRNKNTLKHKRYSVEAILMLLPVLILYCAVVVYPLLSMFYLSFFSWNGVSSVAKEFVGLDNYAKFSNDRNTLTAFKNIGILAMVGIFATLPVSFFLATVINRKFRGLRIVKTMYFLPVVINRMAICLMFTFLLLPGAGPVPMILQKLGLVKNLNLLGNIKSAMWTIAFINMWGNAGFQMIIFSSSMAGISNDFYEAATIDGASSWQKLLYVTLPALKPTICTVIIFILTGTFKVFDFIMGLTGGGPGYATEVPNTLLYKQAFTYGRFGYANAIAVVMVVFSLLITIIVNALFKERDTAIFRRRTR